jgi:actin related protein 2/3 complex subunit 2
VVETVAHLRVREAPESTHLLFADFDGVTYKLSTPESKTVLLLSMSMKCFPELQAFGAMDVLAREYGSLLQNTPEQGYDVTLRLDLDNFPPGDKGIPFAAFQFVCETIRQHIAIVEWVGKLSQLKRNAMAAPFEKAFVAQADGQETPLMAVHYRDQEAMYIRAQPDRVTVIFSTIFKEETDQIVGKVFLQVWSFCSPRNRRHANNVRNLWMLEDSPRFKMLLKSCTASVNLLWSSVEFKDS